MEKSKKRIAIVMGSISDEPIMKAASDTLKEFNIDYEIHILSAHRMPNKTREFAASLSASGIEVVIAGAGKAAHLPGVIASYTTVPVIGVPIKTSDMDAKIEKLLKGGGRCRYRLHWQIAYTFSGVFPYFQLKIGDSGVGATYTFPKVAGVLLDIASPQYFGKITKKATIWDGPRLANREIGRECFS